MDVPLSDELKLPATMKTLKWIAKQLTVTWH